MEAYKKVGRGGAGNFYSKKDIEEATTTGDIESQNPKDNHNIKATPASSTNPPPEYLHSGRGGAGNWVKPSDLQAKGLAQVDADTTKKVIGQSKPTYRGGRGGAGNYSDPAADEQRAREEEERKRKEMEGRVEKDVEAGLARPERAYGGVTGAYEMK